jgi:menaquinone-specific isochorismate synthase
VGYGSNQRLCKAKDLNLDAPAFYFPDFFHQISNPWIQYDHWYELKIQDFKVNLSVDREKDERLVWENPHQDLFQRTIAELQLIFDRSDLLKAVPYVFASCHRQMTVKRLKRSLKKALEYIQHYPGYLYGFWQKGQGILGVTPEILFKQDSMEQKILKTAAIAGTRPKNSCPIAFKNDPKELSEHAFVVEGIQSALKPYGSIHVGEVQVLELPKLNHLLTSMHVDLHDEVCFERLVESLHPTPALGAYPKEKGWDWLKSYERLLKRDLYGAPVGISYPQKGLSQCIVAIRNVQWDDRGMRIGAGCGIIAGSQFEKEWQELNLKISAIQELLSLTKD